MNKVTLYFNSTLHHFSQLLAGLEFLKVKKEIELSYVLDLGSYPADIFKIEFNGLSVFFDLADNSRIYENIYEQCDFYVKRMLLKTDAEKKKKLIPYGLYYPVYYKNPDLQFLFLKNKNLSKYSLRYWKFLSQMLNIKDSIAVNEISKLESPAADTEQIIFRARLWNPANNDTPWKKKERKVLNEQRIDINRRLKIRFPSNFKGGILRDSYSEKLCPDNLLAPGEYHRKKYILELKSSAIGIVNQGLEDSIGAKLGEYVANSLAILTTPIEKFELHGNFSEGSNYLCYRDTPECLQQVETFLENPTLRKDMQERNKEYYAHYLHPAKKLSHIFSLIKRSSSKIC